MRQRGLVALACIAASAMASTASGGPVRETGHTGAYLVTISGTQQTQVLDRTAAGGAAGCTAAGGERQTIAFTASRPVRAVLRGAPPLPTLRLPVAARISGSSSGGTVACGGGAGWTVAGADCGPVAARGRVTLRWLGFDGRVVLTGALADPRRRRACATRLASPYAFLLPTRARVDTRALARHGVARITVAGRATVTDRSVRGVEKRTRVTWTLALRPTT